MLFPTQFWPNMTHKHWPRLITSQRRFLRADLCLLLLLLRYSKAVRKLELQCLVRNVVRVKYASFSKCRNCAVYTDFNIFLWVLFSLSCECTGGFPSAVTSWSMLNSASSIVPVVLYNGHDAWFLCVVYWHTNCTLYNDDQSRWCTITISEVAYRPTLILSIQNTHHLNWHLNPSILW